MPPAWAKVEETIQITNAALEWDGQRYPIPLLWQKGGHPSLPATLELFELESQIRALTGIMQ